MYLLARSQTEGLTSSAADGHTTIDLARRFSEGIWQMMVSSQINAKNLLKPTGVLDSIITITTISSLNTPHDVCVPDEGKEARDQQFGATRSSRRHSSTACRRQSGHMNSVLP